MTLARADEAGLAKLAEGLPAGTYRTAAELAGGASSDVATVADAIAKATRIEASFDAEYAPSLI